MNLQEQIQHKIDFKTKPLGSLGKLETIAFQIANIQKTITPKITNPAMVIFAGDHGITDEKVSPFPKEVTIQMVMNFIQGGAAVSVFCKENNMSLHIADSGVAHDFPPNTPIINAKIAHGTKNILHEPAMTIEQCHEAIKKGKEIVNDLYKKGCNTIAFGEMGIGNTSPAALIMSNITGIPIAECAGKGTGQTPEGMKHKISILEKAIEKHGIKKDPIEIMATYGGFEIAMMTGAFLQAKENGMILLVDGFISTSAYLVAHKLDSSIKQNSIFAHCSDEQGHIKMLHYLQADAVLHMGLRLGEGSGAAVVFPIVKLALAFFNNMASFDDANVSKPE